MGKSSILLVTAFKSFPFRGYKRKQKETKCFFIPKSGYVGFGSPKSNKIFAKLLIMIKLGVMASGGGSNFQAILDRIDDGSLLASCEFLISNNAGCGAMEKAKAKSIPVYHISGKTHPETADFGAALLSVLDEHPVDLLILAGYMKALPLCILKKMPDRILNIHPSLLPKFGGKGFWGLHVHEGVLAAHETESGPTVHLVSEQIDCGRILAQRKVPVMPDDTPEVLQARVLVQEHDIFWRTIKSYAESLGIQG